MPARKKREPTQIVGFRVPHREYKRWLYYADKQDLNLTQFVVSAVSEYIHPHRKPTLPRWRGKFPRWVTEAVGKGDKYVNLRVNSALLQQWDESCGELCLTRTCLIKLAVKAILSPPRPLQPKGNFGITLKQSILNLIRVFGFVDYPRLQEIFEDIDNEWIIGAVNSLAREGLVTRKGLETYMPAGFFARVVDPRYATENLDLISDELAADPSEFGEIRHRRLMRSTIEFLKVYLAAVKDQAEEYQNELLQLLASINVGRY